MQSRRVSIVSCVLIYREDIDMSKNFLLDPSTIIRLASNARMREVTQTAFTELQKAGIDMDKLVGLSPGCGTESLFLNGLQEQVAWAMQTMEPERLEGEEATKAKNH